MLAPLFYRLARNREALIVIGFSVLGALGSLAANRLLTEVASPSELGSLYLYVNLVMWITLPATSSYLFVVHNWPVALQNQRAHWFAKRLFWGIAIQALVALLFCAVSGLGNRFGMHSAGVAASVFCMALGQGVFQLFYSVPGAERKRILSGLLDWANTFCRPLFLAVSVLIIGTATVRELLLAHAAYSLLVGIAAVAIFVYLLSRHPRENNASRHSEWLSWKAYVRFCGPALLGAVVAQVAASAERWGLASRSDAASTALFVQATGLSIAAAGGVNSILMGYFYPIINQYAAQSDRFPLAEAWKPITQFLKLSALFFTAMALGGWFLGAWLTPLFFGARFEAVSEILPIVFVASALMGFTQTLTIPLYTARDSTSPSLARSLSLGLYSIALILWPVAQSNPTSFSWIYLVSQVGYLLIVGLALVLEVRRQPLSAS
jgi:O-antigen/teichoic acid export membrane protein